MMMRDALDRLQWRCRKRLSPPGWTLRGVLPVGTMAAALITAAVDLAGDIASGGKEERVAAGAFAA